MQMFLYWGSLAALAVLLAMAAVGDARRYIIPNRLCGAVAALSLPYWIGSDAELWPTLAWQVALALGVFAVFAAVFAAGLMGGGDVKLLAALALWLPWRQLVEMLVIVAVAGGALTLMILAAHRIRGRSGRPEIPYGIAIVAGAALILGEPLVKHFQS